MKNVKLFISMVISVVTGVAGSVIWALNQDSIRMAKDMKENLVAVLAAAVLPSVLFFVLWYFKCVKANAMVGVNRPKMWASFLCGATLVCIIDILIPALFFAKALLYGAIAAGIAIVGSLVSYLVGEPK